MDESRIFRNELKYLIGESDYFSLRQKLKKMLKPDAHADENGQYNVRSLYFDSPSNICVSEKTDGIMNRKKYRIRIYNHSDRVIKLECKYKTDRYISKEVVRINRDEYERILEGRISFPKKSEPELKKEFYIKTRHELFKPAVVVDYTREAYVAGYRHIRINFDKHLKSEMNSHDLFASGVCGVMPLKPPMLILEVKFRGFLPSHLKHILKFKGNFQRSVSKYTICRKWRNM